MQSILNYILEKLIINKDSKNIHKDPDDPLTWEVGDILAGIFGWSMNLPRFYKIIKRTAKSITVQRMKGKIVSGHRNGQWKEVADENAPLEGKPITGRINKYGGVSIDDCHVHLWNGSPLLGDDLN